MTNRRACPSLERGEGTLRTIAKERRLAFHATAFSNTISAASQGTRIAPERHRETRCMNLEGKWNGDKKTSRDERQGEAAVKDISPTCCSSRKGLPGIQRKNHSHPLDPANAQGSRSSRPEISIPRPVRAPLCPIRWRVGSWPGRGPRARRPCRPRQWGAHPAKTRRIREIMGDQCRRQMYAHPPIVTLRDF